ncbi:MAG TPA: ABC transporter permease [Jatrophihabitans sp.]|nr:ABC transporter permease [Jatrophihabitans sp.]
MTTVTAPAKEATQSPRIRWNVGRIPYFVPALVILVGLIIINAVVNHGFINNQGWQEALIAASPLIVLAMAMTPPILAGGGGVDLSVGPSAGLISVLVAGELAPRGVTNTFALWLLAILFGMAAGAVNGALVAILRVAPIIATLATYLVFAGLATQLMPSPGGVVPPGIAALSGTTGQIPNAVFVLIGLGVLWFLLLRTAFWRNLIAVGSNDRAAFTAGVPVTVVRFVAFVLSGAMAGVGGILLTAVLGGADATVGPQYTLIAIAGAAVGGISLSGGRGGLVGAAAGGASLFLIQNILSFVQVSSFVLQIAYGLVLIVAVLFNGGWDYLRLRRR